MGNLIEEKDFRYVWYKELEMEWNGIWDRSEGRVNVVCIYFKDLYERFCFPWIPFFHFFFFELHRAVF